MLIIAVALFAAFRSGVCIGLFQSSGSHDDDFGVDSRTSAQVRNATATRNHVSLACRPSPATRAAQCCAGCKI
jgi:hypothetical protein